LRLTIERTLFLRIASFVEIGEEPRRLQKLTSKIWKQSRLHILNL